MIFLEKLKARKGKDVTIAYRHVREGRTAELVTLVCADEPRPELYETLNALRPYLLELLRLPKPYSAGLDVIGVTIVESDEGDQAVITALKDLGGAFFVINTPCVLVNQNDAIRAMHDLNLEAVEYIEGRRAQLDLFSGPEKTADFGDALGVGTTITGPANLVDAMAAEGERRV